MLGPPSSPVQTYHDDDSLPSPNVAPSRLCKKCNYLIYKVLSPALDLRARFRNAGRARAGLFVLCAHVPLQPQTPPGCQSRARAQDENPRRSSRPPVRHPGQLPNQRDVMLIARSTRARGVASTDLADRACSGVGATLVVARPRPLWSPVPEVAEPRRQRAVSRQRNCNATAGRAGTGQARPTAICRATGRGVPRARSGRESALRRRPASVARSATSRRPDAPARSDTRTWARRPRRPRPRTAGSDSSRAV